MSTTDPLATVPNNALKRKAADSEDGGANKAAKPSSLKSVTRSMSVEQAKAAVAEKEAKLKAEEKAIRDEQKQIRNLKKQLKDAEARVIMLKSNKNRLSRELPKLTEMVIPDILRISSKISAPYGLTEAMGSNAMEDMFILRENGHATSEDLLRMAEKIGASPSSELKVGAVQFLLEKNASDDALVKEALPTIYVPALKDPTKSSHALWPLLARAMDKQSVDADQFVAGVLAKADAMKKQSPIELGRYNPLWDVCPILDLLLPTFKALPESPNTAAKSAIKGALQTELMKSVNAVKVQVDYSMPAEAEIAVKNGCKFMEQFLLSKTETLLNLDVGNTKRKQVHRLIDDQMPYGTALSHTSKGIGRDRVLVVRKTKAEPTEQSQKRAERKEQHKALLATMEQQ